eukprot:2768749-Amphidinium_carterae.1
MTSRRSVQNLGVVCAPKSTCSFCVFGFPSGCLSHKVPSRSESDPHSTGISKVAEETTGR